MFGFLRKLASPFSLRALIAASASMAATQAADVRLNQIQVVGSHNSYHLAPPSDVTD